VGDLTLWSSEAAVVDPARRWLATCVQAMPPVLQADRSLSMDSAAGEATNDGAPAARGHPRLESNSSWKKRVVNPLRHKPACPIDRSMSNSPKSNWWISCTRSSRRRRTPWSCYPRATGGEQSSLTCRYGAAFLLRGYLDHSSQWQRGPLCHQAVESLAGR